MIPIDQKILHDPEKELIGDCMKACVASVFEIPMNQIPHFASFNNRGCAFEYVKFLGQHGYGIYAVHPDKDGEHPKIFPGECEYYFVIGPSPRFKGATHQCIGHKGKIIHDPHPDKTGLNEIKYFEILVKL